MNDMTMNAQLARRDGHTDRRSEDGGVDETDSHARCRRLLARHSDQDGIVLLRSMVTSEFIGEICLVSAFGSQSAILLHMVSQIDRHLPVIFLQTGKLFPETLDYQEQIVDRLGLTDVREIRPNDKLVEQYDEKGDLWSREADVCCVIRKVMPLDNALKDFGAWITGRKRFQGGARADLPTIEFVGDKFKINPLAAWSAEKADAYIEAHDLPCHPLFRHGYLSIGCQPCTAPSSGRDGDRSGRWPNQKKTECGIHLKPSYAKDF